MEDLTLNISTVNGTGSLSANQLFTKMLFRSGWAVGSYSFFPSNIAGLPCLYNLRLNSKGHTGFSSKVDILVTLNPKNLFEDLKALKPQGLLISDQKHQLEKILSENKCSFEGTHWILPISESLKEIPGLPLKAKALLKNMIYVGFLSELFQMDEELVKESVKDFFQSSKGPEMTDQNLKAVQLGQKLAKKQKFPLSLPQKMRNLSPAGKVKDILIDGNSSSALGALFSGCQFLSWYPITPATSLAESFEKLSHIYGKDSEGKKTSLVLQVEDELAGITQAIGAGWAGLRAMTSTSGPGLSLMSEAAGLAYFTEIPVVLSNVQRVGPSTGLPTRTQQGDLLSACFLSHGDSKHPVLLPGTPEEAFQFTAQAFDMAEELQTLIVVLSDLDLGMNLRISQEFEGSDKPLKRGKVLREEDLEKRDFVPYRDEEREGISYRSLPGIRHPKGAYFNRGSGHDEQAGYSEKPEDYTWKMDKLERKWQTAKKQMPTPIIETVPGSELAFLTFGPNTESIKELRDLLEKEGIKSNFMRVRSFPFHKDVESFLENQKEIFVVELNKEAQLKKLIGMEFPRQSAKMKSLLQYDGRPLFVDSIKDTFFKLYSGNKKGVVH